MSRQFLHLSNSIGVVLHLKQYKPPHFRTRHLEVRRNRKARRFGAGGDNRYEFSVHQEVRTPCCEGVSAIVVFLVSNECSDALHLLCCVMIAPAFGLLFHRNASSTPGRPPNLPPLTLH